MTDEEDTVDQAEREDEPRAADESAEEASAGEGEGEASDDAESDGDEKELRETMEKLEEDPPEKLEEWPEGKAKYETFGGPEGEHGYHEGPEEKLGPSSLRFYDDGRVEVEGDEVDDADEFKGDPIPGGPTDPDAPQDLTTERIRGGDAAARSGGSTENGESDEESDESDE